MLCRVCFQSQATFHVLDRPTDEGLVESHYCAACYESRYVHPPTGSIAVAGDPPKPANRPAFPLSRFTIKELMIVTGSSAILNAALALLMRSGVIVGMPGRHDGRAITAFLAVNAVVAILAVQCLCLSWLRNVLLHGIAGDMPAPRRKAIPRLVGWTVAWEEATPARAPC